MKDSPSPATPSRNRTRGTPGRHDEPEGVRIGELARLLGTTTKTLRFYEDLGLIRPTRRTASGYRIYAPAEVNQARLVLGLRRLGLHTEQIKDLLRPGDDERPRRRRLLALIDEKLQELDLALGVMQGQREDLYARYQALLGTPPGRPAECLCEALFIPCHCEGDCESGD